MVVSFFYSMFWRSSFNYVRETFLYILLFGLRVLCPLFFVLLELRIFDWWE